MSTQPQVELRLKPYIQPFERHLALAELASLCGHHVRSLPFSDPIAVLANESAAESLATNLAYWESIKNGGWVATQQVVNEATAAVVRNLSLEVLRKLIPFEDQPALHNRRVLRYATHGIHEYRGKFFPQLVKALMNMSGVSSGDVVADPMSGSGTTAVEAVLRGARTLAMDMNPLSVFVGRTKCDLLSADPRILEEDYLRVRDRLVRKRRIRSKRWLEMLPSADIEYLKRWFSPRVLADLDDIVVTIQRVARDKVSRDFMNVALSNILREVSWQKTDDLRVRKEIRVDDDVDASDSFLQEMGRSVKVVLAFLWQAKSRHWGSHRFEVADARCASSVWRQYVGRVQAIITSPPYATALPYLDTDRLSLVFLRLLSRQEHRKSDLRMIGNREITERQRQEQWSHYVKHAHELPDVVTNVISRIHDLNSRSTVGFRRRNTASLLATYFFDMKRVLGEMQRLLRPSCCAHIVVGTNHTIAGGEKVIINTPQFLAELAQMLGFEVRAIIPMEMLPSRDIFRANSVAAESILTLGRC